MNGGRFDFDDGGTFCGGWEEGKAHGHGVCTGPEAQGEYAGAWHFGFEVSGVYTWPSGSSYGGQWQNGKRHGLGVEQRGRWLYKGEWTQGFKGRYGRREALNSGAHYLGTWSSGLHDGYGTEVYADGGSYKGQWLRGMRHGYGIRTSAQFGVASQHKTTNPAHSNMRASLTSLRSTNALEDMDEQLELMDTMPATSRSTQSGGKDGRHGVAEEQEELRGGFVLKARSAAPTKRRRSLSERSLAVKRTILSGLRIKKQHSTGDIHQRAASTAGSLRSSGSTLSCGSEEGSNDPHQHSHHHSHHHHHNKNNNGYDAVAEDRIDPSTVETYRGEWKNDGRSGYGVCERSDGLKYVGEWQDNKKHGYGITYFKDGTKEEGRYKNNVLVCSTRRRGILFVRTSKLRERVESQAEHAKRAAEIAAERVDIALSRTMTAQERADASEEAAARARDDANTARIFAAQFDPSFRQPGLEHLRQQRQRFAFHKTQSQQQPHHSHAHSQQQQGNHVFSNHVSFESNASSNAAFNPMVPSGSKQHLQSPHSPYQQHSNNNHHPQQPPNRNRMENMSPLTTGGYRMQQQQQQQHGPTDTSSMLLSPQQSVDSNPALNAAYPPTNNPTNNPTPAMGPSTSKVNFTRSASSQQINNDPSFAPAPQQQQQHELNKGGGMMGNSTSTPTTRPRSGRHGQSIVSLSDDHFDQYTMRKMVNSPSAPTPTTTATTTGPPSSSTMLLSQAITSPSTSTSTSRQHMMEAGSSSNTTVDDETTLIMDEGHLRLRRNRPSLIRQFEVNEGALLNRRSTLATARDRMTFGVGAAPLLHHTNTLSSALPSESERGSLPNLGELIEQGVHLKREEAARLASQRRQEVQRQLEEEQRLKENPFLYLYHPALRNWFYQRRAILLLALGNLLLLCILFYLLNASSIHGDGDDRGGEDD